jgi:orotidine-5'-phosphate decarboxylase
MTSMFGERMAAAVRRTGTFAVVGLDPHLGQLPENLRRLYEGRTGQSYREAAASAVVDFNRQVIDAVTGVVPAVKPQFAFYEQLGAPGFAALEETCAMARAAGLLILGDAKRGDISSTAAAYARSILSPDGPFYCDAVTVNPWMGTDTLDPFIAVCAESGGGIFVLVRTTNPGSPFLQHHGSPSGATMVADALAEKGGPLTGPSGMSSVGAVVGAMAGDEAGTLRNRMPAAWFLVPGVGAQGGAASDAVAGARTDGLGCLVNSSRGVLYPSAVDRSAYDEDPISWIRRSGKSHAERFQFDV